MKGRALLMVSAELFAECLKNHGGVLRNFRVVKNALPDDASVVRVVPYNQDTVLLELESEQFPPLDATQHHCGVPLLEPPLCRVEYQEGVPA